MTAHSPRIRRHAIRRRGSARGVRCAALAAAALVAVTGCTSPSPQQPGPVPGVTGSNAPRTGTGQQGTGLIPPDSESATDTQETTPTGATGPPASPSVATLAWLSGPATDDGILLDTAAGKRWQGAVPGGYALLRDGGYSWFGPDGSMVGCTSDGACVAVDAAGRVAITEHHKSPRLVYEADGHFVGRFTAGGDRLSGPANVPSLQHALSHSGVDVPAMLNAATLAPPFAGGATGDPHLITAGGVRFTSQSAGQFVARGGDPDHAIQLQFQPMAHRHDVSVVSAVAIGAGDHTVIVGMDGTLTVDGTVRPRQSGFEQVTLPSGVAVGRWPADALRVVTVAVVWPDGGSVVMAANPALGLTVVAHLTPARGAVGLFGAGNQGVGPDLVARSGTSEGTDRVVSSWRVTRNERLFRSPTPPVPGFPKKTPAPNPGAQQMAGQACAQQGFRHAEDLAACRFDVALTGDTGFVAGHADLSVPAERDPVADGFAKRWPALFPGSVLGAPDLPEDGRLSFTLGSRKSRAYRIKTDHSGVITLINRSGCGIGEATPAMEQPAMRVFDAAGHAVSDRFALCGHDQTPTLPAGVYNLVVANGPSSSSLSVRVDVTVP